MSKEWLDDAPKYFERYIELVNEDDMLDAMENSWNELIEWVETIDEDKDHYAYEEGKWTVNQVLMHIMDTERIFQYRSLCIARGELNDLPGFDHDAYTENSNAEGRTMDSILREFDIVRQSSISLYGSFRDENLKQKGSANGLTVQPLLYGFLVCGHLRHHLNVLKERY
ncbi:MAG: DinB family protein [Bacteroidia bacterium]